MAARVAQQMYQGIADARTRSTPPTQGDLDAEQALTRRVASASGHGLSRVAWVGFGRTGARRAAGWRARRRMDNVLMKKNKKKKLRQRRARQRPDAKPPRPASTPAANEPEPWDSAVNTSPAASGAAKGTVPTESHPPTGTGSLNEIRPRAASLSAVRPEPLNDD